MGAKNAVGGGDSGSVTGLDSCRLPQPCLSAAQEAGACVCVGAVCPLGGAGHVLVVTVLVIFHKSGNELHIWCTCQRPFSLPACLPRVVRQPGVLCAQAVPLVMS